MTEDRRTKMNLNQRFLWLIEDSEELNDYNIKIRGTGNMSPTKFEFISCYALTKAYLNDEKFKMLKDRKILEFTVYPDRNLIEVIVDDEIEFKPFYIKDLI